MAKTGSVLVIGGGIAGIQASLDLVEQGYKVYMVEEKPSIGGVMAQLDKTFPTNDCAMCILAPKLVDTGRHPNIEIITHAEVEEVAGEAGDFMVKVRKRPRYVKEEDCTGCGICWENCPVRNTPQISEKERTETLTGPDLERVKAMLDRYEKDARSVVPVLQDVNLAYRYLPTDVLKHVAQELDVPLSQVYNIATFYNAFSLTPRGKYVVEICTGTGCYVKGGKRLLEAVERRLKIKAGETTDDLTFTLETVNCLGCCGQSPVMKVNEDIYGYLTPNKLPTVFEKYR